MKKQLIARLISPSALRNWIYNSMEQDILNLGVSQSDFERFKISIHQDIGSKIIPAVTDMFVNKISKKAYIRLAHFLSRDSDHHEPSALSKFAVKAFRNSNKPISVVYFNDFILIYFNSHLVWGCQITQKPLPPMMLDVELDIQAAAQEQIKSVDG